MITLKGYRVIQTLFERNVFLIFRGVRLHDKKNVILKVLPDFNRHTLQAARLRNDYNLRKDLRHNSLINVYGLEERDTHLVLVQEDIQGDSLGEYIRAQNADLKTLIKISLGMIAGIEDIHHSDIIHRDIKPSNYIYNPQTGEIKLNDFGISSFRKNLNYYPSLQPQMEGTPAYISPEQTGRIRQRADHRSDFYSLGIAFYEIFTGRLPFLTTNSNEMIYNHLARRPTPPCEVKKDIPEALSNVIMKLLAKSPDDRYHSARGLRLDLEEIEKKYNSQKGVSNFIPGRRDVSEVFLFPEKIYGRNEERKKLLSLWRDSHKGLVNLILIKGSPGVGKSSLVNDISDDIISRGGVFIQGKFDLLERDIAYSGFSQAFQGFIRGILGESEETLHSWKENIQNALGANGKLLTRLIPELEQIIGPQREPEELGPAENLNRHTYFFKRFIKLFTGEETPLTLYLDDLQWADGASIALLENLILDSDFDKSFIILGAYRDIEVKPSHPLRQSLNRLGETRAVIEEIKLKSLNRENLAEMVRDVLPATTEKTNLLAQTLYSRAGGNPFFVRKLLQTLCQDGIVYFDFENYRWNWEKEKLEKARISENIQDFLASRLELLPSRTMELLKLASCIGNQFELTALAEASEEDYRLIIISLEPAIQEEILYLERYDQDNFEPGLEEGEKYSGRLRYSFRHDRIQQAVYAHLDETGRKKLHLRLGEALLKKLDESEREKVIYDITDHLNKALELINDEDKKLELAWLNMRAGLKARQAAAYQSASRYLKQTLELTSHLDIWNTHYDRALILYREFAEIESLTGNFQNSEKFTQSLLNNARSISDTSPVYALLISRHVRVGENKEALKLGVRVLKELEIDVPDNENLADALTVEMNAAVKNMDGRDISTLLDLPEMTAEFPRAAMTLLTNLNGPAFLTNPQLYAWMLSRMINLTLEFGNTDDAAKAYGSFGNVLVRVTRNYQAGYDLGVLGVKMSEARKSRSNRCRSCFMLSYFLNHWVRPISNSEQWEESGFGDAMSSGDHYFAGFILQSQTINNFYKPEILPRFREKTLERLRIVREIRHDMPEKILITYLHIEQKFTGQIIKTSPSGQNDLARLTPENIKTFSDSLREAKLYMILGPYLITDAMYYYHRDEYKSAFLALQEAESCLPYMVNLLTTAIYNFYHSLTLLALSSRETSGRERVRQNQLELKKWANSAPENFRNKYLLVEAELCRLKNENYKAMELYRDSVEAARAGGFIQEEALANKKTAEFFLELNQKQAARGHILEAEALYERWGALAIKQYLHDKFPEMRIYHKPSGQDKTGDTGDVTFGNTGNSLDLASVIKASQVISGEMTRGALLRGLIEIIIENAGAQKGFLILGTGENALVEASLNTARGEVKVLRALPLEECVDLSLIIVRYVLRTGEIFLINDAALPGKDNSLMDANYLRDHKVKSLLCVPLRYKNEITGALYLENNLMSSAFTEERLEVLNIILNQATISLENARVYNRLEELVKDRTRELENTHRQLLESAHKAGMAEVATGVLHNVGNALNSAIVPASLIKEMLIQSRLPALEKTSQLLLENADSLVEFLTVDPRGKKLPEFVSQLSRQLHVENDEIREKLERLWSSLDHIKEIIRLQQSYARGNIFAEDLFIPELLEDALRIEGETLKGSAIRIVRQYGNPPGVKSGRHKLMLILVNLLSNARDALMTLDNPGKVIRLILKVNGGKNTLDIIIADNGPGISRENLDKIFQHGFTTRAKGHGFGLHSSANAAQELGGELNVSSKGIGLGAEFTLSLPLG